MRRLLTAVIFSLTLISLTHGQGEDARILNPKVKWKFKTQGPIRGSSVAGQENIYFGSADGYLYSVRKKDGELTWKFQTSGSITSTPSKENYCGNFKCSRRYQPTGNGNLSNTREFGTLFIMDYSGIHSIDHGH